MTPVAGGGVPDGEENGDSVTPVAGGGVPSGESVPAAAGGDATVTIDRMRWWHIEAVAPIEADLFEAERWSAAMFWNELASGHHYLVALDAGGGVVGYAGLALDAPDAPSEAWVNNIAVRRDAQRRGIGRQLLTALLAEARRRGAGRTLLEVAADNAPAQRLYARYGFEPVAVRRGYYQPSNTDALVMLREGS